MTVVDVGWSVAWAAAETSYELISCGLPDAGSVDGSRREWASYGFALGFVLGWVASWAMVIGDLADQDVGSQFSFPG